MLIPLAVNGVEDTVDEYSADSRSFFFFFSFSFLSVYEYSTAASSLVWVLIVPAFRIDQVMCS